MSKLKALLLFFFVAIGGTAVLHAEPRIRIKGVLYPPNIGTTGTEAVYMSSVTCVDNTTNGQPIIISTVPAYLYALNVTSPSVGDSHVDIFDGQRSVVGARLIAANLNTTSQGQWFFNIGTSSGIVHRHSSPGGSPGCLQFLYVERN